MKKISSFLVFLLAVGLVFGVLGCDDGSNNNNNNNTQTGSGVDFSDYQNNDAAFFIDNRTNHKLVAFKGSLNASNLLGGIPANADYHGIKKDLTKFTKTEGFPVIFITEEQYNANKNSLGVLANSPFTREYVFYNHGQHNPQRYEISGQVGGRHTLNVINPSGLDVSLRLNGPGGPTLGFATRQMIQTKFPMYGGDFYIYPVFMFYNAHRQVLVQSYPKRAIDGGAYFRPVDFPMAGADTERNFDVSEAYANLANDLTLGVAWVIFDNQSPTASITVEEGTTPLRDTFGQSLFSPGQTRTLSINMPGVGSNTFVSERTIHNLFIRVADMTAQVKDKAGNTSFILKTDHQYTATVTGSVNTGFNAEIDITAGSLVNIHDLYND
ncbi:MAG: hypothetical protein FWD26_04705 [Treponema sp.]|nr:hypothetical protein [Treponema sp.]